MTEPQRPIFGFLWPRPDPRLDEAAVQERLVRVPARGWLRLTLLVGASLLLVTVTASTLTAAIGTHLLFLLPAAAVLATFWVLLVRAWAIGTFVNDRGVVVVSLLATRAAAWPDVASVRDIDGHVELHLRRGEVMNTHVRRHSVDLLGRAEAYDIARLALQRWGEQG